MNIEFKFDEEFRSHLKRGDPYADTYVRLTDQNDKNILRIVLGTSELLVCVSLFCSRVLQCVTEVRNGGPCTVTLNLENRELILSTSVPGEVEIRSNSAPDSEDQKGVITVKVEDFVHAIETATEEFLHITSEVNQSLETDPALVRVQDRLEKLRNHGRE